jgi:spermidine/putrescine transport system permease protein
MNPKQREIINTAPSLVWLTGFVLLPLAIIFVIAFRPALPAGGIGDGWSLEAVWTLRNPTYLRLLANTVAVSAVTTAICVLIALPTAFSMARLDHRWRARVLLLIIVPFWTNFVIRVFAWQQILHAEGWLAESLRWLNFLGENERLLGNFGAVVIVSVYTYLPFAILPLYASAEKFDFHLLDAARDLGARPSRAFFAVFIPGIRQGVATALLVVFIPMLGSYIVPDMVGGTHTQMIGNKIAQRNFNDRNLPEAAALSLALTVLVLAPIFLRRKKSRTEETEP